MKKLNEKLIKILANHGFVMVGFNVFPATGNIEIQIIGKDYFPFDLFCDIESTLNCQLSILCPAVVDGQNSFKLVLRLQ